MADKNAKFSITVEAIDKTTATLRAINMAVARTVRPQHRLAHLEALQARARPGGTLP